MTIFESQTKTVGMFLLESHLLKTKLPLSSTNLSRRVPIWKFNLLGFKCAVPMEISFFMASLLSEQALWEKSPLALPACKFPIVAKAA